MSQWMPIRRFANHDKNIICMPRQNRIKRGKMLKIKGFWGFGEKFHLESTFFGFGGGKSGLISVGSGESHK